METEFPTLIPDHSPRWPQTSATPSLPTEREGHATPDDLRAQLAFAIFFYRLGLIMKHASQKTGIWLGPYDKVRLELGLRTIAEAGSEAFRRLRRLKDKSDPVPGSWIKRSDLDPTTRIYLAQLASAWFGRAARSTTPQSGGPREGAVTPAVSRTQPVWKTSQD